MIRFNILLTLILVFFALALVTSQHKARSAFQMLEVEQERSRGLEIEHGQLELELSTLATPPRVEKIAREKLKMQLPQSFGKAVEVANPEKTNGNDGMQRRQP
ncbi:MAG: cell division protein FtsL [Betaproteobacteria bacterium ADurb.Bin341]|nr:MAG: cell division protein FtsL [Betaproteobacteria bacterium ADurb.Bin341]